MADRLEQFADWYLEEHKQFVIPPFYDAITFIDGIGGIVLYREPPFQVQLFLVGPNVQITEHMHPNVDSYEIYVSGDVQFINCGQKILPDNIETTLSPRGIPKTFRSRVRVYPSDPHSAYTGPIGGSFMSIQHWLNDTKPTSVAEDWDGNPLGPLHANTLENL